MVTDGHNVKRTEHPGRRTTDNEGFCEAHMDQVIGVEKLGSKMTAIIVLLGANAALLLCIFSTLLSNNAAYAALSTNVGAIRTDVNNLQTLTKDHSALVSTQAEILRRLNILESTRMR